MKMMMNVFGCLMTAMMIGLAALAGEVTVTDVTARQRYPWNGKVDITVTLAGTSNGVAWARCAFVATNSATRAALNVAAVTRAGGDTGSGGTWTRRYVWDTNADLGEVKIDDVVLTVVVEFGGVQLWENGPYWAECNVGATKPEEYGYYFWWGDTVGYQRVGSSLNAVDGSRTGFSFSSGNCPTYDKSTSQLQSEGYIDSTGNLVAAHDAATAHLGAPWRMPTSSEIDALISNCDTTWTTRNGVYGRLVTGRGAYASRSIFLPAAGYGSGSNLCVSGSYGNYWSSMPQSGDSDYAWCLGFNSSSFGGRRYPRCYGQSVRPLRGPSGSETTVFTVTVTGGTGSGSYASGTLVTVTANVPETGYKFAGWTGAGAAYLSNTNSTTVTLTVPAQDVSLIATYTELGGVQLWENGPYWAQCNVGATKPEENGYYFWWGDTVGYKHVGGSWNAVDGSRTGYSFSGCPTYKKTTVQLQLAGYIDSTGNLVAAHDAATAHLGAPWRMPTLQEISNLVNKCNTIWTTRNGVYGRLVTGRGAYALRSIFLPAVGIGYRSDLDYFGSDGSYWSSTADSRYIDPNPVSGRYPAWGLDFSSGSFDRSGGCYRDYGRSVRPLRGFAK